MSVNIKIAIVYGTRPELIKLVPLILEMKNDKRIQLTVINTGQHREMVDDIQKIFNITPNYCLETMVFNQTLTQIHVNICKTVEPVLLAINPDLVLIQGDTSSVAAVGMICFYHHIKIGHVEAGLRSFNLNEPFPEEFNRKMVSIYSTFNFAPTPLAAKNLLSEGVAEAKIFITGNTIVDMVKLIKKKLPKINYKKKIILITAHRRENHGEGLSNIISAIKTLVDLYSDILFIWPVHPNPNVKDIVYKELSNFANVKLTGPLDYFSLSAYLKSAFLVWSDSGGIQEECPSYKKPVLILRNLTERPEVIEAGFGILVGTDKDLIVEVSRKLLQDVKTYRGMISGINPFGDGYSSKKIVDFIFKNM
jgi:UDP-N-acetylglucosamine 2-epimerase (non-hydrolysing)